MTKKTPELDPSLKADVIAEITDYVDRLEELEANDTETVEVEPVDVDTVDGEGAASILGIGVTTLEYLVAKRSGFPQPVDGKYSVEALRAWRG